MAPSYSHSTTPVTFTSTGDLTLTITSANTVTYTTTAKTVATYDLWYDSPQYHTYYLNTPTYNNSTYTTSWPEEFIPSIDIEDIAWEDMPENQA